MLLGLPEFDILFPGTVEEACSLLSRYGEEAQILAGGTDLFVKMKQRREVPRVLINIKRIPALDGIGLEGQGGVRIGALATMQSLRDSALVGQRLAVLGEAAGMLGTAQVRNLGTMGGNLGNASPSAECAPPLLILGASVRCVGCAGERVVPMEEFFVGPGQSARRPEEIITEVSVPALPAGAQCVYVKHSLRRMDVAMAGAAILVVLEGEVCREVRIALGAVAPTPFRARRAEEALQGQRLRGESADRELLEEVAQRAAGESRPIDDIRGYASYRRKVVGMLVRHGLEHVIARARGDEGRRSE